MGITTSVFVSYRRQTAAGEARALFTNLVTRLGQNAVFMDVDGILLGRDFRTELNRVLAACDLMLVIIDKDWLEAKDEEGRRRLDNADDFVRMEIAAALKRDIVITPVLVKGARMPLARELPEDISNLAYRQGFELSYSRWDSDVQELMRRLNLDVSGRSAEVEARNAENRPPVGTPPIPVGLVQPVDDEPELNTAPASTKVAGSGSTEKTTRPSRRKGVAIASAVVALTLVALVVGWRLLQPQPVPDPIDANITPNSPRITIYTQISSANDKGKFNALRNTLSGTKYNIQDVEIKNTAIPTNQVRYCNPANEPDAGALKTTLEKSGFNKFQVLKIERCSVEANKNILEVWLQG